MQIISAHSPIWGNKEHTVIDLRVKFAEFDEELPFSASSFDGTEYGSVLFNDAVSGKYGAIEEFPQPAVETTEQAIERLSYAVRQYLDSVARSKGYDSILTAVSYVGSTVYGVEATQFRDWRDLVWAAYFKIEDDVKMNIRSPMTNEALISELPVFNYA
mgnify:CR=1 FL=1